MKISDVECCFEFHPIGQGLFYSGRINNYSFVFDCGTSNKSRYMTAAIDTYRKTDSPLDLLILSHFHKDHISGVKALLAKTNGVNQIILPYLFPAERLMVAAEQAIIDEQDVLDDIHIDFLTDPIRFLTEAGNEDTAISYILSDRPVEDWPESGEPPDQPQWNPSNAESKDEYDELKKLNHVTLRRHLSIFQVPLWCFKFYCQPSSVTKKQIEDELIKQNLPIDPSKIPDVITNRMGDLKKVYMKLFGKSKQNLTSVMCCHGPMLPRGNSFSIDGEMSIRTRFISNCCGKAKSFFDICSYKWFHDSNPTSLFMPKQLLSGDAKLKPGECVHFQKELNEIGLMQLPHHGSKDNWLKEFLNKMPNCMVWVASFGLGNSHHHPGHEVVDDIIAAKRFMCVCHQLQGVLINVYLRIFP